MKIKSLSSKIGGAFLTCFLLFGIAFVFSGTTQAQYRNDDQYRRNRERRDDRYGRNGDYRRNDGGYGRNGDYGRNDDGYGRNGGYGRNNGYGNNVYRYAQEQGYRDGLNEGADRARSGQRYDPQGERDYKKATSGYNSSYGNKGSYKQAYRDGFLRGYQEGFRQYDGYRGGNGRNRAGTILGDILGGRRY